MTKIQITNRYGKVLFEYEKENNTTKDTLLEALNNGANLEGAYLKGANLKGAYLKGAYLYGAYLYGAYLEGANLEGANLNGANLKGANLEGANLKGANLNGANLKGAYLEGANLKGAKIPDDQKTILYQRMTHLSEGDIIGWKKVNERIIKLLIPADAKRCHAIGSRKGRAEYAKVLEISDGKTEILNTAYKPSVLYKVGEMVRPDSYDDDILTECSHGINFFITRLEAEEY